MEELVWRKEGERCERSYRQLPQAQAQQAQAQQAQAQQAQAQAQQAQAQAQQAQAQAQAQQAQAQAQQAQAQAQVELEPPQFNLANNEGFRKVSNKREEANEKINERYLIGQATQNPFMTNNNYVNDLEVQMNFLTPQAES